MPIVLMKSTIGYVLLRFNEKYADSPVTKNITEC